MKLKKLIFIFLTLLLSGCDTLYGVIREYQEKDCRPIGGIKCPEDLTYEEYKRERERLLKDKRP